MKEFMLLQAMILEWLANAVPRFEQVISAHVKSHGRFEHVFELAERRLGADLRVDDLAAAMRLSVSSFSMAFTRNIGMSPKTWLNRRLNQEAIRLLTQTDISAKEIARRLNFADEYYFSRFFKRMNGVSPRPFREKLQGRNSLAFV